MFEDGPLKSAALQIEFARSLVLKIMDQDSPNGRVHETEVFLDGTYVKYNGNDGFVNPCGTVYLVSVVASHRKRRSPKKSAECHGQP